MMHTEAWDATGQTEADRQINRLTDTQMDRQTDSSTPGNVVG